MSDQQKLATINANEGELNLLFRELLEGCRDDLEESKLNVSMFYEAIIDTKDGGKERYGQFYNDSLKIKGAARDRQLKLLNMFKDRVSTKEKINLNKKEETVGGMPDIAEMNRAIEEIEAAKKQKPIIVEHSKSLLEMEDDEMQDFNDFEDELEDDE